MYYAFFLLGLLATSCGGTEYTLNKEEALEQLEQIAKDEKEEQKEFLEDLKDWKEEKDKILKDFDGKEQVLIKKVKKGDAKALDALEELRAIDIKMQLASFDMEKDIERRELVWSVSQSDINIITDDDDLDDWKEDTQEILEKRRKTNKTFYKKVGEIWNSETPAGKRAYDDY